MVNKLAKTKKGMKLLENYIKGEVLQSEVLNFFGITRNYFCSEYTYYYYANMFFKRFHRIPNEFEVYLYALKLGKITEKEFYGYTKLNTRLLRNNSRNRELKFEEKIVLNYFLMCEIDNTLACKVLGVSNYSLKSIKLYKSYMVEYISNLPLIEREKIFKHILDSCSKETVEEIKTEINLLDIQNKGNFKEKYNVEVKKIEKSSNKSVSVKDELESTKKIKSDCVDILYLLGKHSDVLGDELIERMKDTCSELIDLESKLNKKDLELSFVNYNESD